MALVTFFPDGIKVQVQEGSTILEAAEVAGILINSPCGGNGVCGKCKVRVRSREGLKVDDHAISPLSPDEVKGGYLLACQAVIWGDLEVEIPPSSRIEDEQILLSRRREKEREVLEGTTFEYSEPEWVSLRRLPQDPASLISPLTKWVAVELPPPSLEDNVSDWSRLERGLKKVARRVPFDIPLEILKELPQTLRRGDFRVSVLLGYLSESLCRVLDIREGKGPDGPYGVAVDIGTTTVVAQLVDLRGGRVLGVRGSHNRQAPYGEDVLSRIAFACDLKRGGRPEVLQRAVVGNVNALIRDLCQGAGIGPEGVTTVVAAGNTTMSHLLLGIPPCFIRLSPYTPATDLYPVVYAKDVGIRVHPRGLLYVLPSVASYVGGDIVAGVLATGLAERPETRCLIDIGTNGEIVLGNSDWLLSCSASAGPAFEGVGISCGIKASRGAIQEVEIRGEEVRYRTIGDERPRGLCGSGLVEILYELAKEGVVDIDGKLRRDHPRVRETDDGPAFLVVQGEETSDGRDIYLTQSDIDHLMRSKAAVFAAFKSLLDYAGVPLEEVQGLFVAGGFGNRLDLEKAVGIGLLPDLPRERIEFVGNTSLLGARMALLSWHAFEEAVEVSQMVTNLELAVYEPFVQEYMAALYLPHIDASKLFPSVEYWRGGES